MRTGAVSALAECELEPDDGERRGLPGDDDGGWMRMMVVMIMADNNDNDDDCDYDDGG